MKRDETRKIQIGDITLGGSNEVLIQSMCDVKTSHVDKVIKEINECAALGAKLMRVSIFDEDDLKAIKEIVKNISIPLICDIHYNYSYATQAIINGAKKIRINPGNMPNLNKLIEVIEVAKKYNAAIRIGLNEGSLNDHSNSPISDKLVNKALEYINFFEENKFYNLVISLKTTDTIETINSYRKISNLTTYPLHIGLTESGFDEIGIIRSVSALAPLLLEGIGNTIRISLTNDPKKEVLTAKRLLHDLNLYENYPTFISCPTCGRSEVKIKKLAKDVLEFLEKNNIKLKVAIMGCPVNGIGEAKNADIGIAGGKKEFILFKKGKIISKVSQDDAYQILTSEILKLVRKTSN